jgi:hypothetical protein
VSEIASISLRSLSGSLAAWLGERLTPVQPKTMAKLQIAREVLLRTKERSILTDDEKATLDALLGEGNGKGSVTASASCPWPSSKRSLTTRV